MGRIQKNKEEIKVTLHGRESLPKMEKGRDLVTFRLR
jgi:hypothetical protein